MLELNNMRLVMAQNNQYYARESAKETQAMIQTEARLGPRKPVNVIINEPD